MKTEQEQAWAGQFGNDYARRSPGDEEANFHFFWRALSYKFHAIAPTILELGAGTGANVRALHRVFPNSYITALELNHEAADALESNSPYAHVIHASVLDWTPEQTWELVLTKGLLIHILPDCLPIVYETIYRAAARYILLAEYYNPTPVGIVYRGEENRLWKRDFAGEMLNTYPDLRLVDYGFVYRRDEHPQDDVTFFLLEKRP